MQTRPHARVNACAHDVLEIVSWFIGDDGVFSRANVRCHNCHKPMPEETLTLSDLLAIDTRVLDDDE